MAGSGEQALDLSVLGSGPYGTFLWGPSRAVLNRVLFAMVRAVDPDPLWLDLAGSPSPEGDPSPVDLAWIRSERLFLADEPSATKPQDAVANMALLSIVRADEPPATIARLADFVRLPPIAQEIISRMGPGERLHALAIANADRVRSQYPATVEGVRPIVTAFLEAPLLPFFAAQGTPGPGRMAFDFVFEVRAVDLAHWKDGVILPEKAPSSTGVRVGVPIRLLDVPGLEGAFSSESGPK